ncbi:hypothetical protein DVS28_b0489 (plasmid) [Euzebya pacifica]|uniref:Uncharacterized protein n=1 Tax=Euzebya pacifica TaxID=1608957 RepID=A0A346Y6Y2_9ACTN|nr:hypothetical protein [Euzebya pacifica]AXV10229.1 hypothetical protein DVS28_b0489 [Euzebya pacifica]
MVLVVGVAAAVISALVGATASRTYAERFDRELTTSRELADELLAQVAADLTDNPHQPLQQVMEGERDRVCAADASVRTAGESWPLERCGADWTYLAWDDPTVQLAPGQAAFTLVRDHARSRWTITALGKAAIDPSRPLIEAGWQRTIVRSSLADTTAFATGDLDLASLYENADDTTADGLVVYASGQVVLPTDSGDGVPDTIINAVVAADPVSGSGGFLGNDNNICGGTTPCPERVLLMDPDGVHADVRHLAAQPWTIATAQAGVAQSIAIGCPGTGAEPGAFLRAVDRDGDGEPDDVDGDGDLLRPDGRIDVGDGVPATSHLCLNPGQRLYDVTSGTVVTVPASTAVNITPVRAVTGRLSSTDPTTLTSSAVRIRWRTDGTEPDGNDCATACDLTRVSASAANDGVHPGTEAFWDPAGTGADEVVVWPPSTGVVVSPTDTYLGWCDDHLDRTGSCDFDLDGNANPSVDWVDPLTIIAGTVAHPANLWIGNSQVADVPLGLVATGDLVMGYWARQPYADLLVEAHGTALGLGDASGRVVAISNFPSLRATLPYANGVATWPSPIRTAPAVVCTPADNNALCAENVAAELRWVGSIAAPNLRLDSNAFDRTVLIPTPASVDTPPPMYPSADPRWRTLTTAPYSAHSACDAAVCTTTP